MYGAGLGGRGSGQVPLGARIRCGHVLLGVKELPTASPSDHLAGLTNLAVSALLGTVS